MYKEQFQHFGREYGVARTPAVPRSTVVPGIESLSDRSPRTLVYGKTKGWETLHVYLGRDQLIHVLLHVPLLGEDGDVGRGGIDFLRVGYSCGETGGLANIDGYVPGERVAPESSDFEFCKLLEDSGASLSFSPYKEAAPARGAYQGATLEHGRSENGIDLLNAVKALEHFPSAQDDADLLAYRLVAQAGIETKTVFTNLGLDQKTYVAESGVDTVLAKVAVYLREMYEQGVADFKLESLVDIAFGKSRKLAFDGVSDYHGCLMFSVCSARPDAVKGEGLTSYVSDDPCYPSKKFSGTYRGRPFVISTQGDDDGVYRVYFSRFGDPAKFLSDMVGSYELTQAA